MEIRFKKDLYTKNVLFHACYRFTDVAYGWFLEMEQQKNTKPLHEEGVWLLNI